MFFSLTRSKNVWPFWWSNFFYNYNFLFGDCSLEYIKGRYSICNFFRIKKILDLNLLVGLSVFFYIKNLRRVRPNSTIFRNWITLIKKIPDRQQCTRFQKLQKMLCISFHSIMHFWILSYHRRKAAAESSLSIPLASQAAAHLDLPLTTNAIFLSDLSETFF